MSTVIRRSTALDADKTDAVMCFHCGEPVPPTTDFSARILGEQRPMCCPGCQAVAEAIVDSGLDDFYRYRDRPQATVPDALTLPKDFAVYDLPEVQRPFVRHGDADEREASLILEGITCAACVWLNEKYIAALPGVTAININYASRRAEVRWDDSRIHLSDILAAIKHIGYTAHPYDPQRQQAVLARERKGLLTRLGIAGVFGMQVMVIAVALYFGADMEASYRHFFHWTSLALTLPVLLYSAQPFFISAWRDLKRRHAGMDVPVSLGLLLAFTASLHATLSGHGEVYFDSVVMFTLLLLGTRYLESVARGRARERIEGLAIEAPAVATRITEREGESQEDVVAVATLQPGDTVRVRAGETIPADGIILEGRSGIDEALLTGESMPRTRQPGDAVISGSVVVDSPLLLRVDRTGNDTVLAGILQLAERAQGSKPAIARLADRVAGYFVSGVLLIATAVALYYFRTAPEDWLRVTVAVLVVSCPCALSLATPAAMTAAASRLMSLGLMPTRAHAIETLARADHMVLDKTGTLTHGRLHLVSTRRLGDADERRCLETAAALEAHSEHPLAQALLQAHGDAPLPPVADVLNTPGAGLQGSVDGCRYYLGSPVYIKECTGLTVEPDMPLDATATCVLLARDTQLLAVFEFADQLRDDAPDFIQQLHDLGIGSSLLSGDQAGPTRRIAAACGLDDADVAWSLSPEDKLQRLRELQAADKVVVMVGDGINDAPVLAGADVSVAMGGATDLVRARADLVLLNPRLTQLAEGIATARRALGIIRQNMTWAVAYNLLALPVAAAGLLAPWMAALGMSLSSLVVVANALRLAPRRDSARGRH